MNATRGGASGGGSAEGAPRACIVPELQYLMQHEPGCGRDHLGPPLDPTLVGIWYFKGTIC